MGSSNGIYISVVSDDFGMCAAVNDGIVQAFTEGLLTDANLMAPCPAFTEASQLARAHQIPVGIHATFTAEWDHLRWKPLTPLRSMIEPDGTFRRTVSEAWRDADLGEAATELDAQWDRIASAGLAITHLSEHMGGDAKLAGLLKRKAVDEKVAYRNFTLDGAQHDLPRYDLASVLSTGQISSEVRVVRKKLEDWIESLGPGHHMWVTHCAVDHPSLAAICEPTHHSVEWARTYRMIDQALVLDADIKARIERRGIKPVPLSQCPRLGL
jgi:predicted glycoside hydrolase/deacetylase ChbG (UPF0249 family)